MVAHTERVVGYVRDLLAAGEPGDETVAVPAAILHDVGMAVAVEKYGSTKPPGQEVEGAVVARRMLAELGWPQADLEAICGIVGIHHHRHVEATAEFRLVYDADLLVNAADGGKGYDEVGRRFYSDAARRIAKGILGGQGDDRS